MTQIHENAPSARDHANVRFFPPLAYAAPMAAGLAMHFALSDRFLPQGWVQLAAGLPLMAVSALLAVWASMTMRRAGTTVAVNSSTTAVVVRGPFRFSRNPIYLSLTGLYVGIAVSVNALWVIVLLPVALVSITLGVIAREESYLERKFGTGVRQLQVRGPTLAVEPQDMHRIAPLSCEQGGTLCPEPRD